MAITQDVKKELVEKYRYHEKDCGSADVQVAILTERIRNLTKHLETHKKDHSTRRGLLMMVSQRNTLLKYIRGKSAKRYQDLIKSLGLRK